MADQMKLILRREAQQPDANCTLGLLFVGDLTLCTIERPWVRSVYSRGGAKGVSCVPAGTYALVRHDSEAHPKTWALVNSELGVEHFSDDPAVRSVVLIHPANYASELRGCIAPGTRTAKAPQGGYMVAESRKAFRLLQGKLTWDNTHSLEII